MQHEDQISPSFAVVIVDDMRRHLWMSEYLIHMLIITRPATFYVPATFILRKTKRESPYNQHEVSLNPAAISVGMAYEALKFLFLCVFSDFICHLIAAERKTGRKLFHTNISTFAN